MYFAHNTFLMSIYLLGSTYFYYCYLSSQCKRANLKFNLQEACSIVLEGRKALTQFCIWNSVYPTLPLKCIYLLLPTFCEFVEKNDISPEFFFHFSKVDITFLKIGQKTEYRKCKAYRNTRLLGCCMYLLASKSTRPRF